jgi:endo-1,4-beta-xylanase
MRRLLVASVLLASFSVAALPRVSQAAPLSKPVVTVQPTDRTVRNDEPPVLRSKATGNPTPTVVWEASLDGGKTFTAGTGADYTKDDLDLRKVIADSIGKDNLWYLNGARFRATYTNSQGTATTDTVTLTVNFRPKLFLAVQDQSVKVGQMAKFEAACAGNPKPTVQWQVKVGDKPWQDIEGATMADNSSPPYTKTTYTTGAATIVANGFKIRAKFTNTFGSEETNAATLTVTK